MIRPIRKVQGMKHIDVKMYEAITDFEGLQYFGVITVDGVVDFYAEDTKKELRDNVSRRVASEVIPGETILEYGGNTYLVELSFTGGLEFKLIEGE